MKLSKFIFLLSFALMLSFCTSALAVSDTETFRLGRFRYDVPSHWLSESEEGINYHYAEQMYYVDGGYLVASLDHMNDISSLDDEYIHAYFEDYFKGYYEANNAESVDFDFEFLSEYDFKAAKVCQNVELFGVRADLHCFLAVEGDQLFCLGYTNISSDDISEYEDICSSVETSHEYHESAEASEAFWDVKEKVISSLMQINLAPENSIEATLVYSDEFSQTLCVSFCTTNQSYSDLLQIAILYPETYQQYLEVFSDLSEVMNVPCVIDGKQEVNILFSVLSNDGFCVYFSVNGIEMTSLVNKTIS